MNYEQETRELLVRAAAGDSKATALIKAILEPILAGCSDAEVQSWAQKKLQDDADLNEQLRRAW